MSAYVKTVNGQEMAIGISTMPNRKKIYLYIREGNKTTALASFNNKEAAYKFMDTFADFVGAEKFDWSEEV